MTSRDNISLFGAPAQSLSWSSMPTVPCQASRNLFNNHGSIYRQRRYHIYQHCLSLIDLQIGIRNRSYHDWSPIKWFLHVRLINHTYIASRLTYSQQLLWAVRIDIQGYFVISEPWSCRISSIQRDKDTATIAFEKSSAAKTALMVSSCVL